MDMIAVPGGQGAMENWGLITFGDTFLLMDEKESSASSFRMSGSVIVHELAHQWFGNLVTMEFWDGLWLNESFADWAELYAWETLDPRFVLSNYFSHIPNGLRNESWVFSILLLHCLNHPKSSND
jgi:aminopeptidase 2